MWPSYIALEIHTSDLIKEERAFFEIRYVLNRSGRTINADKWTVDDDIGQVPIPKDKNEVIVYWKPKEKGTYKLLPLFYDSDWQFNPDKSCAITVLIK